MKNDVEATFAQARCPKLPGAVNAPVTCCLPGILVRRTDPNIVILLSVNAARHGRHCNCRSVKYLTPIAGRLAHRRMPLRLVSWRSVRVERTLERGDRLAIRFGYLRRSKA